MPITIYGRHTSYNVQKVLWLADELAINYTHIEFGASPQDTESAEFGQLNPMRKVPVLVDDKKVIWESNSILRYLARSYGKQHWLPHDPFQASLIERWMDWSQTRFEPAFVGVFWGHYRTPQELRDNAAIAKSLDDCKFCLKKVNEQLEGNDYLLGKKLTLADITVSVFLHRLINIGLDVSLPVRVQSWYQRLGQLPAYRQWVLSDFSGLKGRLQY